MEHDQVDEIATYEQFVELLRSYEPVPAPRPLWLTAAELAALRARCTHPADVPVNGAVGRLLGVPLHIAGCDACSTARPIQLWPVCSCVEDCRSPRCTAAERAARRAADNYYYRWALRHSFAGPAIYPPGPLGIVTGI